MPQKTRLFCGTAALLVTACAIAGIYYITVLFSNSTAEKEEACESPQALATPCNGNVTINDPCYGLSLTRRYEWLAQPPTRPINKLKLPTEQIILSDTGSPECSIKAQCLSIVRNIQEEHIRRGKDDIEYNFLMDTNGGLYEGRGWMLENGHTSSDAGKTSYWIAFIGSLSTIPSDDLRINSMEQFLDRAVAIGKLKSKYQVFWFQNKTNSSSVEQII